MILQARLVGHVVFLILLISHTLCSDPGVRVSVSLNKNSGIVGENDETNMS